MLSPVTGAWRRWSPKTLLHYSIQSFNSSISNLIFCKVVCYGIRSPLVGCPRFGRDGATPWQPGSVLVTYMAYVQSWLQIDKNESGYNFHLLPFWKLLLYVIHFLLHTLWYSIDSTLCQQQLAIPLACDFTSVCVVTSSFPWNSILHPLQYPARIVSGF